MIDMIQNAELENKKAVIFDFDDVLYPKRDYLLQVYYLFGHFVEYNTGEALASPLIADLKSTWESAGEEGLFERVAARWPQIKPFEENFERLHHQAQLPLKLELFPDKQALLRKLVADDKVIVILTAGDPLMQLNKIKQVDWQGLERLLKVYFEAELYFKSMEPLDYLQETLNLRVEEMSYIGQSDPIVRHAQTLGMQVHRV